MQDLKLYITNFSFCFYFKVACQLPKDRPDISYQMFNIFRLRSHCAF